MTSGRTVALLYFDGCPNWRTADERLRRALAHVGRADAEIEYRTVSTHEEAAETQFGGSPTILIDGVDPTSEGLSGAPDVARLTGALA